jgi:hypothetical protein
MRDLLSKMRGKWNKTEIKNLNEMTVRDMLKITRKLNENEDENVDLVNKVTPRDVDFVEKSIQSSFRNTGLNVNFDFPENNDPHELYVDEMFVYWGATINNVLMFTYTINNNDDADTGVKYKYIEESSVLEDSDEYKQIVEKIEEFFNSTFYPYFRELMN